MFGGCVNLLLGCCLHDDSKSCKLFRFCKYLVTCMWGYSIEDFFEHRLQDAFHTCVKVLNSGPCRGYVLIFDFMTTFIIVGDLIGFQLDWIRVGS